MSPKNPQDSTQDPADLPLLRLGFRPFYLLAAAFAVISVPLWLLRLYGLAPALARVDMHWHMHEMLFGFVVAVVIGFLYTAGRKWTGLWTPRGKMLAMIVGVWLAGRAAMLLAEPGVAALIDLCFLPLAAWPLYRVLKQSGNRRNMVMVLMLGLLWLANALFHAAVLGWLAWSPARAIHAAILLVVMVEAVIAGRVIPGFTANAVPGCKPLLSPVRDRIALASMALAGIAWVAGLPALVVAVLALLACGTQILRLAGWMPWRTTGNPLLWILHLSYGWIALGFFLLAFAALGWIAPGAAFHVLGIGALAGMIIGMMTRTALGHTGRALRSGRAELAMYLLLQLAMLARLAASLIGGELYTLLLVLAAVGWSGGFGLYLLVYAPYLTRARVDGRED